jgi:acetyl-CoA carboxylase carboxyl transferase subunit beta
MSEARQSGEAASDRGAELDPFADEDLDLTCPGCRADLTQSERFAVYRVCPDCGRHFPLPARERLALLLDGEAFVETNAALLSVDPLVFHDHLPYPDRLAEAQEALSPPGLAEGVITGLGTIGGVETVIIVLDLAPLGGAIGALAGEKITLALEQAAAGRLPVVAVCAGGRGPLRAQEGMLALVQLAKIASAAANLRRAGLPLVAVLAHPTTGGVYVGLANQADFVLAEAGARIGYSLGTDQGVPDAGETAGTSAEALLARGLLDAVVERPRLHETLATLLDLVARRGLVRDQAPALTAAPSAAASPRWETGAQARHPDRPTSLDYLPRLLSSFVELHGDRIAGDDPAVVCGVGRLAGVSVAVVAQERGRGAEAERRRDGRMRPEGFRKADRVMRLAGRLDLPVVVLVDGPGAATGPEAETDGLGVALAQSLGRSSLLPVPIVTAIVGEAGGVAAAALGAGDRVLMLEHAVYAVPGGDRPAPAGRAGGAGGTPRWLTARECQRLGVVDVVVPEPAPAAHAEPDLAAGLLLANLAEALDELIGAGSRRLLAERSRRLRTLGMTTAEGRAAARREALDLLDLQDLPRHLARSLGEWRERLELRYRATPLRVRPLLPVSRAEIAGRIATLRANVAGAVGRVAPPVGEEQDVASRAASGSAGTMPEPPDADGDPEL